MPSIEDIDEDEPAPIVIGKPQSNNSSNATSNSNNNNNKDLMDDLFGPGTSSSSSPVVATSSSSPTIKNNGGTAAQPAKAKDALDDFFGPKSGVGASSSYSYSSSTSNNNNNNLSNINTNSNQNKGNDVFDSLFTNNSTTSSNSHWHGGPAIDHHHHLHGPTSASTNTMSLSSSSSTSTVVHQQRSAIDHLDAFSAITKGSAIPWKQQTQSVAESQAKVIDIFGDGSGGDTSVHNDRGVFIPPDQVLSLMTLYDVLGAAQSWSVDDISKAYRAKAIKLHPDKLPGGKRTEREDKYFKVITAAYDILKDKDKRAEYDAALRGGSSAGSSSWLNFVS